MTMTMTTRTRALFALLLLLSFTLGLASAASCSATNKCGEASPCCSEFAFCGAGPEHCLGGCDPDASFKPSSCRPMPRCKSTFIDFTNNGKSYVPLSSYRGDPTKARLTLDQGIATPSKAGLKLSLTKDGDGKLGTRLSTTRYWYYGTATAVMKHDAAAGVVHTFISMSNSRDEIDWEFTTDSPQDAQTNYYWKGDPDGYTHGYYVPLNATFDVSDWHAYTVDWSPNRLRWLIDGQVVRTLYRKNTLDPKTGIYHYPATPARLQLSVWGAGTDDFPQGTRDWAGGYIDWSKAPASGFTNIISPSKSSAPTRPPLPEPAAPTSTRPNSRTLKLVSARFSPPQRAPSSE